MPLDIDSTPAAPRIHVAPSAPLELSHLLCSCSSTRPRKIPASDVLVDRARRFWDDGYPPLSEETVLAHATGSLGDLEIEPFLHRLGSPIVIAEPLPLETELPEERDTMNARLRRLATDRRLRVRYRALLDEIWETFADIWAVGGRERALATAAAWIRRLEAGSNPLDLLPERHIARRDAFAQLVRVAHRDGTLWLTPTGAGYGQIVALPGVLSVSAEAARNDPAVLRREAATEIADSLRVLSDPTRLTILAQLAATPASVSDLARTLHLAQPTTSVHVRQLREAGLVTGDREGARTIYTVEPATVEALLASVAGRLAETMTPPS